MTTPQPDPEQAVTSRDRLTTTLFFAALVHGIVILGVGFMPEQPTPANPHRMEVTVTTGQTEQAPEDPDYYAQMDQRGSGNTKERVPTRTAASAPEVFDTLGLRDATALDHRLPRRDSAAEPNKLRAPSSEAKRQLVTASESRREVASAARAPATESQKLRIARQLERSSQRVRPVDETTRDPQATAENPEETFVAVNTEARPYASYLHRWRTRVERVGTAQIPKIMDGRGTHESVTVEVALQADGSIRDIEILDTSTQRKLDRAVMRILREAAPFESFPDEMRKKTDVIRFAYEWRFKTNSSDDEPRSRVLTDS